MINADLFARALAASPLIAILRGISPNEAIPIVEALRAAGIRIAEVPLNSPEPFDTIGRLRAHFGEEMVIGAGTVVDPDDISRLAQAKAQIAVAPNADVDVIRSALAHGMVPVPGFSTPGEAFHAYRAGARFLKFFPALDRRDELGALIAVLPRDASIIAVGGVGPANAAAWLRAGAAGVGVGSELFRPGMGEAKVAQRAQAIIQKLGCGSPEAALWAATEAQIGEAPTYDVSNGRLHFVDPLAPALVTIDPQGESWRAAKLSAPVWSIASFGRILAGTLDDSFCTIDPATAELNHLATIGLPPGVRLNDMSVDPAGGLWAGSMHRGLLAGRGAIHHCSPAGGIRIAVAGLGVVNGMAFNAAADILYVVDTLARTLLAFPADIRLGALGEPTIVTDFMNVPGKPDGMTRAPDGSLWVAMWGGGCVVQIDPSSGALMQMVAIPAPHVGSLCAVGDTLYVTTARARLSEAALAAAPQSGAVFRIALV